MRRRGKVMYGGGESKSGEDGCEGDQEERRGRVYRDKDMELGGGG